MRKWHRIIAMFLAFIFISPFVFAGCRRTGSSTSIGGGSGSSSGSGSGSGSGSEENPDTEPNYIEFEDAITGTRATFIVDDATKDKEYANFANNAIQSAQTMAKDILYRLCGEYIETYSENHGIDMDNVNAIPYTASESKYLSGYNNNYDIDFYNYSEDKSATINLLDLINQYKPFGLEINNTNTYNDNKFILIKNGNTESWYKLDSQLTIDGITIKDLNYISQESIELNAKQLATFQEYKKVIVKTNEDETTTNIEIKGLKIEVVEASTIYNTYTSTNIKDYLKTVANKESYTFNHTVITGGQSSNINWKWYSSSIDELNEFVDNNYDLLSKAILAIMSNKDLTSEENKNFAQTLNTVNVEDLVNDIIHYGIKAKNDDGTASKEVENIVKYILSYCIGDDLVKMDQARIYKFDSLNDKYVQLNSDTNSYNYSSTERYNDANLNNLNMNQYAVNAYKYNIYNISKNGVLGSDNIKTSFVSFDNILAYNFSNDNNYFITGQGKDLGLVSNGYQSNDVGLEYAVNYGFQNYINTVETIVSTVCNATLNEIDNQKVKLNEKLVYNYVPNVYDFIKNGLYTSLVNNSTMDPSFEENEIGEASTNYANFCPEGEQHYQSVVLYPGTTKYKQISLLSICMTFESTLGVENLDMFLRYHKANAGFVKFKVGDNLQDYIRINDEPWNIVAGKTIDLQDNSSEYEIEFENLLKQRIDVNSEQVNTVNNAIIGVDNSILINTMMNVYKDVKKTMKSLVTGSGQDIEDKNYGNSAYTKNSCFPAIKVNTLKGEQVEVYGYDNKDEEYLEILFATDEDSQFNFAYYFTDFEEVV